MLPRRAGVIVNNASVLGWRAQAGQAHYAAAKAGVMALTRCAAIEARRGRRARERGRAEPRACTRSCRRARPRRSSTSSRPREAFGRAAEPWEVANVIVFLASDYSTYMTGEIVAVSSQHPREPLHRWLPAAKRDPSAIDGGAKPSTYHA